MCIQHFPLFFGGVDDDILAEERRELSVVINYINAPTHTFSMHVDRKNILINGYSQSISVYQLEREYKSDQWLVS